MIGARDSSIGGGSSRAIPRLGHGDLIGTNDALPKAPLAIAEVVAPHADEAVVEAHLPHGIELAEKPVMPCAQCVGVVAGNVTQVTHLHIGDARQRIADDGKRGQAATGEDVALDEVHRIAGLFIALLGHGDRLYDGFAMGLEQAADGGEIGIVKLVAHGLDHFDRYQLVEAALQIAIVIKEHRDAIL